MRFRALVVLAALVIAAPTTAHAGAGDADRSFGGDGEVQTSFGGFDIASSLAVQRDGKIVVGGWSSSHGAPSIAIARYLANGTLDRSFDRDGKVKVNPTGASYTVSAVAVGADGSIAVAGTRTTDIVATHVSDIFVARFTRAGALDLSFGTRGVAVLDLLPGVGESGTTMQIQRDGKLIVGGYSMGPGSEQVSVGWVDRWVLARLDRKGALDPTFGIAGKVIVPVNQGYEYLNALRVLPNGSILAAGGAARPRTSPTPHLSGDLVVARLSSMGVLDPTFGSGGFAALDSGGHEVAFAMDVMSNGKILLGGAMYTGDDWDWVVGRLTANGAPDTSFSRDGVAQIRPSATREDFLLALAVQRDGAVVVAGYSTVCRQSSSFFGTTQICYPAPAFGRVSPSGSLDKGYAYGGVSVLSWEIGIVWAAAMSADRAVLSRMGVTFGRSFDFDFVVQRRLK